MNLHVPSFTVSSAATKATALTVACFLVSVLSMTSNVSATFIFDATPANTTLGNNNIGPQGTLTGTAGNLTFVNNGNNFNFSGFFSTQDVNTLNGSPITAADTVTTTISVAGLSVGVLRANGIDFGLNDEIQTTAISNNEPGDNVIRLEASNAGGDILNFFMDQIQTQRLLLQLLN